MRNPVALFSGTQLSDTVKLFCAYGTPTSVAWDTSDVATLVPTTIHADGDQISGPEVNCASSASEVVVAISGQVRVWSDEFYTDWVYYTRFYRSTDDGATWTYSQMIGGAGAGRIFGGGHQNWYDGYKCYSMIYSDADSKFYAFVDHWEKADWTSTDRSRFEVYSSADGQVWALESAVIAWQNSMADEWFQILPHSNVDSNLSVDTNGYVYLVFGGGNVAANLVFWKSVDAGGSWSGPTTIAAEDVGNPTNSVLCIDEDVVVTQGDTGYWQVSQDGGASWQSVAFPANTAGPLSIHDGAGHHTWMYNSVDVTTERWTSTNVASGTPPSWARTLQVANATWGFARCKSDPIGLEDHVVAGCRKSGNNLIGVLLGKNVSLTTPIWTVATGLTLYTTIGFDVTGYSDIPATGNYTYFF